MDFIVIGTQNQPEMPSQAETLSSLAGSAVPEVDLPDLPWLPLPEKVLRAFPDLEEWHQKQHAALVEWKAAANYILRRG